MIPSGHMLAVTSERLGTWAAAGALCQVCGGAQRGKVVVAGLKPCSCPTPTLDQHLDLLPGTIDERGEEGHDAAGWEVVPESGGASFEEMPTAYINYRYALTPNP